MSKPYTITRPKPAVLILKKSRRHSAISLGSLLVFYSVWYVFQLGVHKSLSNIVEKIRGGDWFTLLFMVVPFLSLMEIIRSLKNFFYPRTITLDSDLNRISDGAKVWASFDDLSEVEIKTLKDSDGPDEFALSMVKKEGGKLRMCQSRNYEDIFELADEISDKTRVKVEKRA